MSKAILISINPKHVMNILNGKKTIELRKTYPHCALPIDVYIYCTSHNNYRESLYELETYKKKRRFDVDYYVPSNPGFILNGKVVAKFTLKEIREAKYQPNVDEHTKLANKLTCLTDEKIDKYFDKKDGYGWVIDNLVILDKPMLLKEFHKNGYDKVRYKTMRTKEADSWRLSCAPQSWCYVEAPYDTERSD